MNVGDRGGLHSSTRCNLSPTIRELEPAYRFPPRRTTSGADAVPCSSTVMAADELVLRASILDSIIPAPSFNDASPPPATGLPNVPLPPPRPTIRQQRVAKKERAKRTCGAPKDTTERAGRHRAAGAGRILFRWGGEWDHWMDGSRCWCAGTETGESKHVSPGGGRHMDVHNIVSWPKCSGVCHRRPAVASQLSPQQLIRG